MKKLKIPLTAVALLVGVAGAFATTAPKHQSPTKTFAYDQATNQWIDVTGQTKGVDYRCNSSEQTCTAQFTNDDPGTGQEINQVPGTYQDLSR